jgi:uncharacterized lipoprotein YddW (UPF0748 family)
MPVVSVLAVSFFGLQGVVPSSRFIPANPLPGAPAITVDKQLVYQGPTKTACAKANAQGRVLWIDATANIERYNSEEKIISLVEKIADSGFNTIVFDVKPISSEMVYPSAFAPKLTEWKGKILGEFDPAGLMVREARINGLSIFFSMNAFCDGHRLVNRGPGFARPEEQCVVYESKPIVVIGENKYETAATLDTTKIMVSADYQKAPEPTKPDPNDSNAIPPQPIPFASIGFNKFGFPLPAGASIPRGGFVLTAVGANADTLNNAVTAGGKVSWESQDSFVNMAAAQDKQYPLITSPTHPAVRTRLFNLVREAMVSYSPDGIIFDDRLRYSGLNGDFSPSARDAFESYVKQPVNWPEDIYKITYNYNGGLQKGLKPGKFYEAWLGWRALTLRQFVVDARKLVQSIKPSAQLGVYAGSWYGEYQVYGNNWASTGFNSSFWFQTPSYAETGMAKELDFLITGCYYPTPTIHDSFMEGRAIGANVEASGNLSYRAADDDTFVYAGLSLADFKENPAGLAASLQSAVHTTNGVMVFDLSHDIEPMWSVFKTTFGAKVRPPHAIPGLLAGARIVNDGMRKRKQKPSNVTIAGGLPGVGF